MTDLVLLAIALSASAFLLSFATAVAYLRQARDTSPYREVPYEGPGVGKGWPLSSGKGLEVFVAVSKRCPSCVQLLDGLRTGFDAEPLRLLVLGPPLDEPVPPAWSAELLPLDLARKDLGLVSVPYGVVVSEGLVAAHFHIQSAAQFSSMLVKFARPRQPIGVSA